MFAHSGSPAGALALRDGRSAAIRTAGAADSTALRAFFGGLSRETLRRRFHTGFRVVPEYLLSKLVSTSDDRATILVAESSDTTSSSAAVIGEARYVRMNDAPEQAEAAIVVADEWREVGLGRRLVNRLLAHARNAGVKRVFAQISRENEAVIRLLRSFGGRYVSASGGEAQMVVDLAS